MSSEWISKEMESAVHGELPRKREHHSARRLSSSDFVDVPKRIKKEHSSNTRDNSGNGGGGAAVAAAARAAAAAASASLSDGSAASGSIEDSNDDSYNSEGYLIAQIGFGNANGGGGGFGVGGAIHIDLDICKLSIAAHDLATRTGLRTRDMILVGIDDMWPPNWFDAWTRSIHKAHRRRSSIAKVQQYCGFLAFQHLVRVYCERHVHFNDTPILLKFQPNDHARILLHFSPQNLFPFEVPGATIEVYNNDSDKAHNCITIAWKDKKMTMRIPLVCLDIDRVPIWPLRTGK